MAADFHAGDRVYVKPIGTVSRIAAIVCAEDISGAMAIVGYRLGDEIEANLFSAGELELVAAGEARRLTEAHLSNP